MPQSDTERQLILYGLPHPTSDSAYALLTAILAVAWNGSVHCTLVTDPDRPLDQAPGLYLRSEATDALPLTRAATATATAPHLTAEYPQVRAAEAAWRTLPRLVLEEALYSASLTVERLATVLNLPVEPGALAAAHDAFPAWQAHALPYSHPFRFLAVLEDTPTPPRREADTIKVERLLVIAPNARVVIGTTGHDAGHTVALSLRTDLADDDTGDASWRKERDHPDAFDRARYLEDHDDVRAAEIDPLHHYIDHGEREGRIALRQSRPLTAADHVIDRPTGDVAAWPDLPASPFDLIHLHGIAGESDVGSLLPWLTRQLRPGGNLSGRELSQQTLRATVSDLTRRDAGSYTVRLHDLHWTAIPHGAEH